MNGIQIEHILNLIESTAASNRAMIRREVVEHLRLHMAETAESLSKSGSATIPTSYGDIVVTKEELSLVAA